MKTFIFIIIFLMMYLIIQHFIGHSQEGLANCSSQEQAVNNNTATIAQQQSEIDDFKSNMQSKLNSLKTQVQGFNAQITKNATNIATNAATIKSTVKDIQSAKQQKQKALNKAGGGL